MDELDLDGSSSNKIMIDHITSPHVHSRLFALQVLSIHNLSSEV